MADFYRPLTAIVRAHGWQLLRPGKGSHEFWFHPQTKRHITVPRTTKSRHTANDVLKRAGISKQF
jgi:predicted RNA binding protein YcfA (HicA-like mRNA interferase family)